MVVYKISSQFTDFVLVKTNSEDKAKEVLSEVGGAIRQLGALNHPLPGVVVDKPTSKDFERALTRLVNFHRRIPSVSDSTMQEALSVSEIDKDQIDNTINEMYNVLSSLITVGISRRTRKLIESFLSSWSPITVQTAEPSVLRGVERKPDQDTDLPVFEPPPLNKVEDRQIRMLDEKAAALINFLVKSGVIEEYPSLQESKTRLAERKFKWAKVLHFTKER